MKPIYFLYLLIFCSVTLFGCKETKEERRQRAIEMMTTQTMGLAYLEEFKLEEAEKEFLKLIELAPDEKLGYANLGLVYLRMGKYEEAEKQIRSAIQIDPNDADIRLLLATVYQLNGDREKAVIELKEALNFAPDHVKTLYDLAEIYSADTDETSQTQRKTYLEQLVNFAPGNIVPQLQLTELLIHEGDADKALERLEVIKKQFPEFPREAVEYYDETLSLLKKGEPGKAEIPFTIFHNYIKVTFPYQAGINELKGPGGSNIGFPLITYNRQLTEQTLGDKTLLEVIKFKAVSASAGLDIVPVFKNDALSAYLGTTHAEAGDYDGDGDIDLYVGSFDPATASYKNYLFNNDNGRFKDIARAAGINHSGFEAGAKFTDYDNDGFLDLYVLKKDGSLLYRNADQGVFSDQSAESKIDGDGAAKGLFFDMDHDGDLDLFQARSGLNRVYRNNGDGTFLELAELMGLTGKAEVDSRDAAFGDFDDDGDVDLIVVNHNSNNVLYTNQRQGIFQDITEATGLEMNEGSSAVAVGDYNNDGFLDLLIGSEQGKATILYHNLGDGSFALEQDQMTMFAGLKMFSVMDAEFFDFDNDGFLDIILVCQSKQK